MLKTMNTVQNDEQFRKRMIELARKSDLTNQYIFTDFLSMAEVDILHKTMQSEHVRAYELFGGMEDCERLMARFGSEEIFGYEVPYPIVCIHIAPLMEKFAETLSHRDYLGAMMNLGIDRSMLGDIVIIGKHAYVFSTERMSEYIIDSLDKVRHTNVRCRVTDEIPKEMIKTLVEQEHIVENVRADAIVAKVYHLSRSQSLQLFREQKVYVGGRLYENNSGVFHEGDVVSVRGYGKFRYDQVVHQTRKGKQKIQISLYQ